MRETGLRVLAAGLMTGAIAAVVGMSTLVGTPNGPGQPITAAPLTAPHAVRIHVAPVPPRRTRVKRARPVQTLSTPPRPGVIGRRVVTIHTRTSRRQLASTKPKAQPAVAPTVAVAPAFEAQRAAPTPLPTPADEDGKTNNGHAYGHDKKEGRGREKHDD